MTQLKQTDRSSSSFLERADSDIDDHGLLSACSSNESFDSPIDDHLSKLMANVESLCSACCV